MDNHKQVQSTLNQVIQTILNNFRKVWTINLQNKLPKDGQKGSGRGKSSIHVIPCSFSHFTIGSHNVICQLFRNHWVLFLTLGNISSHQFHVNRVVFTGRLAIIFVNKANVLGNSQIVITIGFVCNQPEIQKQFVNCESLKSDQFNTKCECYSTTVQPTVVCSRPLCTYS